MVRYADDFIVMVQGTQQDAEQERLALAQFLKEELRMELSMEKTRITDVREGFDFLGYRVAQKKMPSTGRHVGMLFIPKGKSQLLRDKIKAKYGKRRQAGPSPISSTTSIPSSRAGATTTGTRRVPGRSSPSTTGGCGGA